MSVTVIKTHLPLDTPRDDLEGEVEDQLQLGALSCRIEEEADGFVIVTLLPGPDMIAAAATGAAGVRTEAIQEAAASGASEAAVTEAPTTAPLGELSEKFESKGDPGAIGNDSTGGPSYGQYQIATKTGTMASFLKFLARTNASFANKLEAAGGNAGATSKSAAFVAAWKELARDPAFREAQHGFIKATHYDPFIQREREKLKVDINTRSLALQNVAWSTVVQHGPANKVFENALNARRPVGALSDQEIINAVYNERSNVDRYFSKSTLPVKESVKKRFVSERANALQMLA